MTVKQQTFNRLDALDGARGVAISLVVMFHAYARWPDLYPYGDAYAWFPLFKYGWVGVELFFLISGFVILMTLERHVSLLEFIFRRWIRLFPAMLICSVLIFLTSGFLSERPGGIPKISDIIPGILFIDPLWISGVFDKQFHSLEGGFWTLYLEMRFYFIFGFIYFLRGRSAALNALGAIFVFSCLSKALFKLGFAGDYRAIDSLMTLVDEFGARYFGWFAAGGGVYVYYRAADKRSLWYSIAYGISSSVVCGGLHIDSFVAGSTVFLVFLLSVKSVYVEQIMSRRFVVFLGNISYPLYLINEGLVVSLTRKIGTYYQQESTWQIAVIPIISALIISALIAFYVEPFIKNAILISIRKTTRLIRDSEPPLQNVSELLPNSLLLSVKRVQQSAPILRDFYDPRYILCGGLIIWLIGECFSYATKLIPSPLFLFAGLFKYEEAFLMAALFGSFILSCIGRDVRSNTQTLIVAVILWTFLYALLGLFGKRPIGVIVMGGIAGIVGIIRLMQYTHRHQESLPHLAVALLVPELVALGIMFLYLTKSLYPQTYDGYLIKLDGFYGGYLFAMAGRGIQYLPNLYALLHFVYDSVPLMAVLTWLRLGVRNGYQFIRDLVTLSSLGIALYLMFPAAGPVYLLGDFTQLTEMPLELADQPWVQPVFRNCVPSLHFAWALLFAFPLWNLGWIWRVLAALWVLLTVAATQAFGYHYVVDLIATLPFIAAVLAWRASYLDEAAAATGVFVAWLLWLFHGAQWLMQLNNTPLAIAYQWGLTLVVSAYSIRVLKHVLSGRSIDSTIGA